MTSGDATAAPRYSLIVPAHNAEEELPACLEAIAALETRPWEVIVVDDASSDATAAVAERAGARLVPLEQNVRAGGARNAGTRAATGDVFVFVDSDIMLRPDALDAIDSCFARHPDAGALTGCLAGDAPVEGYFSRYKNRYMAYVFDRLPRDIDFLFTSAAAAKRQAFSSFIETPTATEDTELGKRLAAAGVKIVYCEALCVQHLKRYTLRSFYRNDFRVPFSWASIFLARFQPGALLRKGRFAHASLMQIAGLGLATASVATALAWGVGWLPWAVPLSLLFAAVATNARFLTYLARHEGALFALAGIPVSFVDQLVMSAGVFAGACTYWIRG